MKNITYFSRKYCIYFCLPLISIILSGCPDSGDKELATKKVKINAIFSQYPSDTFIEQGKLSQFAKDLFKGLQSENKDCANSYILEPTLTRGDLPDVHVSIATDLKDNGFVKPTPERDFKLVEQNLDEVEIPKEFNKKNLTESDSLLNLYINSEDFIADYMIVFSELRKSDSLNINGKTYKLYSDISEIRSKILNILCQNPKATFALLIDPPSSPAPPKLTITSIEQDCQKRQLIVKTSGGDGSQISYSAQGLNAGTNNNVFSLSEGQLNGKPFTFIAKQGNNTSSKSHITNCPTIPKPPELTKNGTTRRSNSLPPVGNLTIIKGTEGCEVCTRYYSAVDAAGRMHEIRERNSTNCCPCGKTIEMRGRTYLMNCDGNPRLELVD